MIVIFHMRHFFDVKEKLKEKFTTAEEILISDEFTKNNENYRHKFYL